MNFLMRDFKPLPVFGAALALWIAAAGCSQGRTTAAKPIPPEQVAPTIETAFKVANPEAKEAANDVVAAMQSQDHPRALVQLQVLAAHPDLTPEQSTATARSLVSVLTQLQIAAANGNKAAADILQKYRASK